MICSSAAVGADGTVYVGSDDSNLYAINPDGSEKWRVTTGGEVRSSPAIGSDGTIYVGSHDGRLYAIVQGNQPPDQPVNTAPGDEATDVSLTPTRMPAIPTLLPSGNSRRKGATSPARCLTAAPTRPA